MQPPDDFVDLDRQFVEFHDEDDLREPHWRYEFARARRRVLSWAQLLESRLVVILGEAGVGKTTELRARSRRLTEGGTQAFFVRMAFLVDEPLDIAFETPEDAADFKEWLLGDQEAVILVDSIDEARALDQRVPGLPVRKLAQELGAARDRVRLVLSCRVSQWFGTRDLREVCRCFGVAAGGPEGEAPPMVRLVHVVPLDWGRVDTLARHTLGGEAETFLAEARGAHALPFLSRPEDVLGQMELWENGRGFGSHQEVVEANIERKLRESDPGRAPQLAPPRVRLAVEELAAGCVLCHRLAIEVPGCAGSSAVPALSAEELLGETWSREELGELLQRPIFDEGARDYVQFHTRAIAEFLSAEWVRHNLDASVARRLFIRRGHGGEVLAPSLRAVAAWLAPGWDWLRHDIVRLNPAVLIEFGDAEQLTHQDRVAVLEAVVRDVGQGQVWDAQFTTQQLARFAAPELVPTIRRLLAQNPGVRDVTRLILELIRAGELRNAADLALELARAEAPDGPLLGLALEAAARTASLEDARALYEEVIESGDPTKNILRLAMEEFHPRVIDDDELVRLARRAGAIGERITAVGGVRLGALLSERLPIARLRRILPKLLAAAEAEGADPGREVVLERGPIPWWWDGVTGVSRKLLQGLAPGQLLGAVELRALALIHKAWGRFAHRLAEGEHPISSVLKRHEWRRQLFEAGIADHGLWQAERGDWAWLLDVVEQGEVEPEIRERALDRAAFVLVLRGTQREEVEELRTVAVRAGLEAERALDRYVTSQEQRAAQALQSDRWRREHEEQQKQRERDEHEWRDRVAGNLAAIATGEDRSLLVGLAALALQPRGLFPPSFTGSEWQTLRELLDPTTAEATRSGLKCLWRLVDLESPSEAHDAPTWLACTAILGVATDFADGLDPRGLGEGEARRAAMLALCVPGGGPPWLEGLAKAHPQPVFQITMPMLAAAWESEAPSAQVTLRRMAGAPSGVRRLFGSAVLELLWSGEPPCADALEAAVELALPREADFDQFAILAENRLARHQGDSRRATIWLKAWLRADADDALLWLERHASSEQVESLAAALKNKDDREDRDLAYLQVRHLARLAVVVHRHVQESGDDQPFAERQLRLAQRFRQSVLQELAERPGSESYDALQELARHKALAGHRAWLLHLARSRARADVDEPLVPSAVQDLHENSVASDRAGTSAEYVFRRSKSGGWEIVFEGRHLNVGNWKALYDVYTLIQRAGQHVMATELDAANRQWGGVSAGQRATAASAEVEGRADRAQAEDLVERAALAELHEECRDLKAEIERAEREGDLATKERLEEERGPLLEYLQASLGLGGRSRQVPSASRRAADRVNKRIRHLYEAQISGRDEGLARHLQRALECKDGGWCYRSELSWQLQ